MAVVRCNHGEGKLTAYFKEPFIDQGLAFHPIILNFNKKSLSIEDLPIFLCRLHGLLHLPTASMGSDLAFQTTAEGNQPLMILTQKLLIDPRFIIESLEMGKAHQFNEIEIPNFVLNEQR